MLAQGLNYRDSVTAEHNSVKNYLARKEELWQLRAPYDYERKQICDYIFPRRDFELSHGAIKGTRKRRLVDSTAQIAHERCSATIFGYLISPSTAWIRPELLDRDFTYAEDSWADETARRMHRYLMSSASTFRTQMAEDLDDCTAFGDSVLWQQRPKRGRGTLFLSVPNKQCAWAENEQGVIEENFRIFPMTLRRALLRFPDSVKLKEAAAKSQRPEATNVEFLHIVEPRPGGVAGDLREIKPWRDIIIYIDGCEVVEIGGHDRKPLNVGRFKRRPGENYGWGPGWTALALSKLANAILETIIRNAESLADPPLLSLLPASQSLDRRPGAVNHLNSLLAAGLRDPKDAIQRINVGGDVNVGFELLKMCWNRIDQAFYIDWMTPREGPQKTATEIYDLRDMRLRSLGPIVARVENEKMSVIADNTYTDMMESGMLPRPPASLDRELMGFDYLGPLALAQRQGEVEGFQRYVALGAQIVQTTGDPSAARMLKAEPALRAIANAYGVEGRFLASPDEMTAFREGQRQAGEMQEEMAATEAAARALQAGGQGIKNLSSITQPGGAA
jgi:hypothetical protein